MEFVSQLWSLLRETGGCSEFDRPVLDERLVSRALRGRPGDLGRWRDAQAYNCLICFCVCVCVDNGGLVGNVVLIAMSFGIPM